MMGGRRITGNVAAMRKYRHLVAWQRAHEATLAVFRSAQAHYHPRSLEYLPGGTTQRVAAAYCHLPSAAFAIESAINRSSSQSNHAGLPRSQCSNHPISATIFTS